MSDQPIQEVVFEKARVVFRPEGWIDVYCDEVSPTTPLATFDLEPPPHDVPPYAQVSVRMLVYSPAHGDDPLAWAAYYRGETVIEMDSYAYAEEIPDPENPRAFTKFFHFPYPPIAPWRYAGPLSLAEEALWLDKLMRGAR